MKVKQTQFCKKIINAAEVFLALVVTVGVIIFFVISFASFTTLDWSQVSTFYEFINRILILVVGLELARLLITHDINAVTYLLMFVVARKVIVPESSSLDIFLAIIAFALLFVLNSKLLFMQKKD